MLVCHLDGSGEEGVCELPHVVRPGGGEERGLARGVSLRHDGADIPLETLGQIAGQYLGLGRCVDQ